MKMVTCAEAADGQKNRSIRTKLSGVEQRKKEKNNRNFHNKRKLTRKGKKGKENGTVNEIQIQLT